MGAPEWIARFQSLLAAAVHARTALVHAAQRLPGFQFDETMAGRVTFASDPLPHGERDIVLRLHVSADHLGSYLAEGRTNLTGTATVDGLVDGVPLSGSLWIWPHRRIVRYDLSFPVGDKLLRLAGQKDVRLLDFRYTMSTLPAKLYDENGAEIGHATVVFNWNDLPSFLRSFALQPLHDNADPIADAVIPDDASHASSSRAA